MLKITSDDVLIWFGSVSDNLSWTNYDRDEIKGKLKELQDKFGSRNRDSQIYGFIEGGKRTKSYEPKRTGLDLWIDSPTHTKKVTEANESHIEAISDEITDTTTPEAVRGVDVGLRTRFLPDTIDELESMRESRAQELVVERMGVEAELELDQAEATIETPMSTGALRGLMGRLTTPESKSVLETFIRTRNEEYGVAFKSVKAAKTVAELDGMEFSEIILGPKNAKTLQKMSEIRKEILAEGETSPA